MNQKLLELKNKTQDLIDKAVNINNQQKTLLNFLFQKLEEVKELETLEQLKEYKNGVYLKAYLFYQSIKRANYQPEHLKLTKLDNIDKCLEVIEKDIEANEPKEQKPKEKELSNRQLLILLGENIAIGEINRELRIFGNYLMIEDEQGILKVDLQNGQLTPDPAGEFFKKHGIKNYKK